jgi:hypothetical protein
MAELIDDEVMTTIAACGTPAEVARHIADRVDGVAETVCFYQAAPISLEALSGVVSALK